LSDRRLSLELELHEALGLWLALRDKEREETIVALSASLRSYLYDHLSIDEMERPAETWLRLRNSAQARR
jgi:hypothetical protein